MGGTSTGQATWRRLWRRRCLVALFVGALSVAYTLGFLVPSGALDLTWDPDDQRWVLAAALLFVAVEYPRAHRASRRRFAPVARWLDGTDPPTDDVADLVHALPHLHGRSVTAEFAVAVTVALVLVRDSTPDLAATLVLAVSGAMVALHMGWLVFLVVEAALRGAFADLEAAGLDTAPRSLATRLLVTVLLCAGVVVAGAAVLLSWPGDGNARDLARAVLPLFAFILIEGGAIVTWAVLDLSRTVGDLRRGLAIVEGGDLSARVPVSVRTELGMLQRSFNAMVTGLREGALLERLLQGQVGRAVAEESVARGAWLDPERRRVTVLFVDMIGSTALAATVPPEMVARVLNRYFDVVARTVEDHGGEVLQFQGDGAVCLFGAPRPDADHATAALRTARSLQRALDPDGLGLDGFRAAVGVSTGTVVVGHVGNEHRHSYSAVGDAANEAARLVTEAKDQPGLVLAAQSTVHAAAPDEQAWWVETGTVRLRGRPGVTHLMAPRAHDAVDGAAVRPAGLADAARDAGAPRAR